MKMTNCDRCGKEMRRRGSGKCWCALCSDLRKEPPGTPTPAEIAAMCKEFRRGWTKAIRRQRLRYDWLKGETWELPIVSPRLD